ncbi:hypothetical protein DTO013E5_4742 [Penicillium roqueforti]|uniref:uncharacterized protein n=1 Tax=Penicillium roqueforti TaxID=5082 RepID=UPI00190A4724|nr:uncharacterized protein LCP9604111_6225 [Penicillium roqueforti]KAF9247526.1 hypothetical protein LCP9604111_6225 [Penicillium roqueforti]KAI1834866.1 hypothetical protein CBS147337_4420 [Penicillium roqueforti]KAI2676709.1 hypothetical protein CBS147355_5811 [Penicillium roqueforti]KAI2683584.1 hypothetical protein LCP963914a_5985 [Penicillium roqueforti]KAI2703024.1 hypothetical protein CBS147372_3339 [Penicillium roqueforti]
MSLLYHTTTCPTSSIALVPPFTKSTCATRTQHSPNILDETHNNRAHLANRDFERNDQSDTIAITRLLFTFDSRFQVDTILLESCMVIYTRQLNQLKILSSI